MMMKNTFRKYFENNQVTHNNIVQIFGSRVNEASLVEDESEVNNEYVNQKQDPCCDISNTSSNLKNETSIQQMITKNDEITLKDKRFSNYQKNFDPQQKDYQETNILSPNADAFETPFQSGYLLKDSNSNEIKTFSFVKRNNEEGTISCGDQNKSDAQFFDFNTKGTKKFTSNDNTSQQNNENNTSSPNKKVDFELQNQFIRQCSSVEDNLGLFKYDKTKGQTLRIQNVDGQQLSTESKPSPDNKFNLSSTMNKSRGLNSLEVKKRQSRILDGVNLRKKSKGLTIIRNKKDDKRYSDTDIKQKQAFNFLGVLLKMKSYAYKMASTVESKRFAIIKRQQFEYLRDKSVVFGHWEKDQNELNEFHPIKKMVYKTLQKFRQTNCIKKLHESIPNIPLFLPQSYWKFFWDILNLIIVIIFFFFIPLHFIYNIKFSIMFYFETLDISLTIISTLDIIVNLNTALFQKGNLQQKRLLIFLEYFSRDGFLSVIYTIMLWVIVINERAQFQEPLLDDNFGFVCIIIVLLKIISLSNIQNKINDRFYLKKVERGITMLLQIFFNLFIVSHLFASTWLVIGKYNQSIISDDCENLQSSTSNQCELSWLSKLKDKQDLAFYEEYLRAYYFTTVTMITVGYGDITPTNSREYLLSVLTMLIACGMFGYSLNSIGHILAEMNTDQKSYNEHFYAINGYMNQKNIPIDLQFQVREYLQYFFVKSNQEDLQKQQKVISLLPENLQNQIIFEANKIVLNISPIFKLNFSEQILSKTIRIIESKKFRPGEQILKQETEDDCSIYFIEKGSVEIYNQNSKEELKILNKGQAFGEISFFTGMTRQVSIRSLEFTTLLSIKRINFFDIVKNSPIDLEKFCMIKDQILFNNRYEGIGVSCYCCKSSSHIISECNFVHLSVDKFKIIREYVKDEFQKREKDIQRNRISYNALENINLIEECAQQCVEDYIDDLQKQGWFTDLVNKELQGQLWLRGNSSFGAKNLIQMRTTSINDYSHKNLTPKANQIGEKIFNKNHSGIANIKIQYPYTKSVSSNIKDREYDSHSNLISDYNSNYNLQKPNNASQFRRHSLMSDGADQQHALNFHIHQNNQARKVQFSITSLPAVDDEHFGDRSNNQYQSPSQLIQNQNSSSNSQYQPSFEYNTPTARQRLQSLQDRVSSINVLQNNHSNFNNNLPNSNFYTQSSGITNSNNNPSSNPNIININNQSSQVKGYYSRQLSNSSSTQDYIQEQKQLQNNTPTNNIRNHAHSQSTQNHNLPQQRQKNVSQMIVRGSKKKITIKTDQVRKRQRTETINSIAAPAPEKQQNEAFIKQLQELMSHPNLNKVHDSTPFENLKNFQIYMPHNNHDRIIINYMKYLRKNLSMNSAKRKRNSQKPQPDSLVLRNGGTFVSTKQQKTIQQYKEIISDNLSDNQKQISDNQINNSIKSLNQIKDK